MTFQRNIVLIISMMFVATFSLQAQELSDTQGAIRSQAEIMAHAYEESNYDLLLNYTYPAIITTAGGRDVLRSMIAGMMQELEAQGYHLDSVRIGDPGQIYAAGEEWHAVIPQFVYMTTPDGQLRSESYLLAVSQDRGARWYFLDTKQLTPALKASFFPNFNQDLVIPESE